MKRTGLSVIALLICIIASPCFAQDNSLNQQAQAKTIFSYKSDIGFSDDQEVKLKALLYDEQSFLDTNNKNLKALGVELGKLINNKGDMQAIRSKLEEISKIQVEITYHNIDNSRKIETILTPGQIEKWRDIQKKFYAQAQANSSK
jgi:hypothetical protein